ncbi:hypothetical protein KOW79_013518 [Hemibagrus wyckioides]|uniref:Uncharacterized protein n=1 Tax=Hemibagrus wyckioides TaxID=337641 RepID=A0A9D3NHW2_9TELE|nr:hypothetical protein KOW79_013518 [Hemibagrus wyckioides]
MLSAVRSRSLTPTTLVCSRCMAYAAAQWLRSALQCCTAAVLTAAAVLHSLSVSALARRLPWLLLTAAAIALQQLTTLQHYAVFAFHAAGGSAYFLLWLAELLLCSAGCINSALLPSVNAALLCRGSLLCCAAFHIQLAAHTQRHGTLLLLFLTHCSCNCTFHALIERFLLCMVYAAAVTRSRCMVALLTLHKACAAALRTAHLRACLLHVAPQLQRAWLHCSLVSSGDHAATV